MAMLKVDGLLVVCIVIWNIRLGLLPPNSQPRRRQQKSRHRGPLCYSRGPHSKRKSAMEWVAELMVRALD
jgi:hypothetical protein